MLLTFTKKIAGWNTFFVEEMAIELKLEERVESEDKTQRYLTRIKQYKQRYREGLGLAKVWGCSGVIVGKVTFYTCMPD